MTLCFTAHLRSPKYLKPICIRQCQFLCASQVGCDDIPDAIWVSNVKEKKRVKSQVRGNSMRNMIRLNNIQQFKRSSFFSLSLTHSDTSYFCLVTVIIIYKQAITISQHACLHFCCFPFFKPSRQVWLMHPHPIISILLGVSVITGNQLIQMKSIKRAEQSMLHLLFFTGCCVCDVIMSNLYLPPENILTWVEHCSYTPHWRYNENVRRRYIT